MQTCRTRLGLLLAIVLLALLGCEGDEGAGGGDASSAPEATFPAAPPPATGDARVDTPAGSDAAALVAARPYHVVEPDDYDASEAAPLVVVLHGYGQGAEFEGTLHLIPTAAEHGALLAYPLGTVDAFGRRFWNATDVCCDFFRTGIDDVAYLAAVIDDMSSRYEVDAGRVYVVGYSNGAFMAQRLACELDERIAAVVSVAGVNWADPAQCTPSAPVAVLQVHGDADPVIHYLGGRMTEGGAAYPSVQASIEGWRDRDGCAATPEVFDLALDIAADIEGPDTSVMRYEDCEVGGAAELWTVHGGNHDITFSEAFAEAVWEFLEEHSRP